MGGGGGGELGAAFLYYFFYDDDLCLISLSSNGMQQLLNICQNYATNHQLLYNSDIKIKQPSIFLNDLKVLIVENCRYLGISISTENSDLDLKRQMRKLYANANLLLCKIFKLLC